MKDIQDIEDFNRRAAGGDKPFCAVFSADWCPDCRVLKAVLPDLEEEFGDRFDFAVVDRDAYPELGEQYNVMGIPSLVVLENGAVRAAYINRLRKTRRQIADFLEGVLLEETTA